ncbi:hypothetical protein WS58_23515 [Burkholderia pseudomultivorans]|nr:hypothetical protein WS56_29170 [Burkholderia pseudomultivorans]KVC34879.1 hypothetical protein WS55_32960 [Burkholderia pseudomultivorans]KVC38264.1 hypothetical protein WS58_23515 [Burkholderia pseudomultivorans]
MKKSPVSKGIALVGMQLDKAASADQIIGLGKWKIYDRNAKLYAETPEQGAEGRSAQAATPHAIDVFSEIYARATVRASVVGATNINRQFPLRFEKAGVYIHVVQQGAARLRVDGRKDHTVLLPDDVVTVRATGPHRVEREVYSDTRGHQDATDARVITAMLRFDELHGTAMMTGIPEIVHVRAREHDGATTSSNPWISTTIAAIELELRCPSVGSEIMLAKTAELLFVWVIRHYLHREPDLKKGLMAALKDPAVNLALSKFHADPKHDWTVPELARLAGQSRSTFCQRFVDAVGMTPIRYLTDLRMRLAAYLLTSSNLHVVQIADQTGYVSQAAFGRAFRRSHGVSPSEYRKRRA